MMIDTLYSSIDSYSTFCRISSGVASYDITGRVMLNTKDGAEIADNVRAFQMISITDFQINSLFTTNIILITSKLLVIYL